MGIRQATNLQKQAMMSDFSVFLAMGRPTGRLLSVFDAFFELFEVIFEIWSKNFVFKKRFGFQRLKNIRIVDTWKFLVSIEIFLKYWGPNFVFWEEFYLPGTVRRSNSWNSALLCDFCEFWGENFYFWIIFGFQRLTDSQKFENLANFDSLRLRKSCCLRSSAKRCKIFCQTKFK